VYVWFDALINYASAVGLGQDESMFERWWPADLHVIGKDITRFHAVIWPAMLMAAGLPLHGRIFVHGFMTVGGQRMSKSLGTAIDPIEAAARFGADPLRLYLTKEIAFGSDGDFSWDRYDERYNVDLANNLGNLVSRVSAMASRYCSGTVRPVGASSGRLAARAGDALATYRQAMDAFAIHDGAAAAFRIVDATNEFIAETAPWTLAKDPAAADRVQQVLFDAAEAIRIAAVMLTPVMPESAAEILRRVGAPAERLRLDRDGTWRTDGERAFSEGPALWPRKEEGQSGMGKEHIVAESGPQEGNATPAGSPLQTGEPGRVTIDEFMKIDLRVARILHAERVPKSTRLLKLRVDAGTEERTIVAGIADGYEPDALVGRTVVIVFNLKPAKLMGVESNGMVLAASPEGGKPTLLGFDIPPAPGARVR
jgi:methionyl-tRNA synthetase